jgi:hypothetical protein
MAPFIGPDKRVVMNELRRHRKGPLQITLGHGSPEYVLRVAGSRYELCPLVLDSAKAELSSRTRMAEGYYVPEMNWAFLSPGAPIILESDLKPFLSKLESWPGWEEMR